MNRKCLTLFVILISIFQSGCWNQELNEIGAILGTAIDLEEDKWVITYQIVIPRSISTQVGGGGSQSPVTVFSTKGTTLLQAIQRSSLESSRTPFFAHNRVLIISEKVAKEKGVSEIVDFYLRNGETRETMDVVLSKGPARYMLETLTPQEKIPSNTIDLIFKQTENQLSIVRRVRLIDFVSMLADPQTSAVVPEIRIEGNPKKQSSLDALNNTVPKGAIKIGDIGIFKKDKLTGLLKQEEGMGIAWLTDHVQNAIIPFACAGKEQVGSMSTFVVDRSSTNLTPVIRSGKITMMVEIETEGKLNESSCALELNKPENILKVEKQLKKQIREDILRTWEQAKEMKADILGFGQEIHKKNPREWRKLQPKWGDQLKEVELDLKIEVSVRRTGMINKPFSNIMEK
ncbi:Ger(x)C family spore germination protein [Ectobacillus funiculus]|uniref:Ger(x)C family spore germination protein n=1 Tax=Ectobacillus funiculus TaxID=137993 RepID=UPI00397E8491